MVEVLYFRKYKIRDMIRKLMKPTTVWSILIAMLVMLVSSLKAERARAVAPIARPNCPDTCGNESIPFPFGIGENCFLDAQYEIECKASPHPINGGSAFKPFLSKFDLEVKNLSVNRWLVVSMPPMNVCVEDAQSQLLPSIDLRRSPYAYNFYTDSNVFVMQGCSASAVLTNESKQFMAACTTICGNHNDKKDHTTECYGVDCCQTALSSDGYEYGVDYRTARKGVRFLQFYEVDFVGQSSGQRQNCLTATLIKKDYLDGYTGKFTTQPNPPTVPVTWSWSWMGSQSPNISSHAYCIHDEINGRDCYCRNKYFGNPYVTDGCQECSGCDGSCTQIETSYTCNAYLSVVTNIVSIVSIPLSLAFGPLLLVFGCRWLYYFNKRRRKTERRVRLFKLMLQQHQSSTEGVVERTKLFTHKELHKATNQFNENQILGKGGQGTVYKGMLRDGKVSAIKKPMVMDESQIEQFINEVVILSQINHRNVVKLLGCCLETEVPLVVYEFISNGTLTQHIHHPSEEFVLSWAMRLNIASDTAGAIAYLHSSSSNPIYHRDIKSSNILLDTKYKAKVSDFGCSKTITIDQTHLTTLVEGTFGYLDPEYFESNVYTEKSDVYSFGVVLLELLTSKKPIYRDDTIEQKSLVFEFLTLMQNCSYLSILDPEVVKEAKEEELVMVVELAKHCLNGSGSLRPTMKEVAITLQMIIKSPSDISLNQETLMKNGVTEASILDKSGMDISNYWLNMHSAEASCSFHVESKPLLFNSV